MRSSTKLTFRPLYFAGLFFIAQFLYFFLLNRYHLAYSEQMQLFRYDWHYIVQFFLKPGGFSELTGTFFTQFFEIPFFGAVIITLTGISIYLLSNHLFKKFRINGFLWSIFPVLFFTALQSDYLYKLSYSFGFVFALLFILIYVSVRKSSHRYITGFAGWILLYLVSGSFSFFSIFICILYEFTLPYDRRQIYIISGYLLLAALFPYIAWKYIFLFPLSEAWLRPYLLIINSNTRITLLMLMGYYPCIMIIMKIFSMRLKRSPIVFTWNFINIALGLILFVGSIAMIKKFSYDPKAELFIKTDHAVQQSNWDKVLELSPQYPEVHRMIVYFTNLALLKSGQLGDKMFQFRQFGSAGLTLPWMTNDFVPFYGCAIFYHLGYFNEAYHWAFEAVVANGYCPSLLKHLIMISLINGDLSVAKKHLSLLNQTLFYRSWAKKYLHMLQTDGMVDKDKEISVKREYLVHTDFFAGDDDSQLGLRHLLENNPGNRMAFEYLMAAYLLNKDILSFINNIHRLKDFGFKEIPVHYEEVLLWYMGYSRELVIPDGYAIRQSTLQRFKEYAYSYSLFARSPNTLAGGLKKEFGDTYWYYYHFVNSQKIQ